MAVKISLTPEQRFAIRAEIDRLDKHAADVQHALGDRVRSGDGDAMRAALYLLAARVAGRAVRKAIDDDR